MSMLDKISKPADRPIICTITGEAGTGKTTLAATFPNPIFIRAEDGMQSIPEDVRPMAFDQLRTVEDFWEQITCVLNDEHDFKTLVIDSITKLDLMLGADLLREGQESRKKEGKSVPSNLGESHGGFQGGYKALAGKHLRVRRAAEAIRTKRQMNIVFIAHTEVGKLNLPDEEEYSRYSLKLHKDSLAPYLDDVDLVGFIKQQSFIKGDNNIKTAFSKPGKAISTQNRILVCYKTAANVSKNRYHITDDIQVIEGENPLIQYVPWLARGAS